MTTLDKAGLEAAVLAFGDAISWGVEPHDAVPSAILAYLATLPAEPAADVAEVVERLRNKRMRVHDLGGVGWENDPDCLEAATLITRVAAERDEARDTADSERMRNAELFSRATAAEAALAEARNKAIEECAEMTDMTLCASTVCPVRARCRRNKACPDAYPADEWQWYADWHPEAGASCPGFIEAAAIRRGE